MRVESIAQELCDTTRERDDFVGAASRSALGYAHEHFCVDEEPEKAATRSPLLVVRHTIWYRGGL